MIICQKRSSEKWFVVYLRCQIFLQKNARYDSGAFFHHLVKQTKMPVEQTHGRRQLLHLYWTPHFPPFWAVFARKCVRWQTVWGFGLRHLMNQPKYKLNWHILESTVFTLTHHFLTCWAGLANSTKSILLKTQLRTKKLYNSSKTLTRLCVATIKMSIAGTEQLRVLWTTWIHVAR